MSVLIKAALIAVLLYLMLKSVANLVRAVLDDPAGRRTGQVGESTESSSSSATRTSRAFGEVEVEDARWEDL
ncbi:MAG: hypothetical protein GVY18_13510 [Bacteroidetes bacterium]|jgi:hypothetical protein|nr:hypothetical protein [Bacteroidota bacterium]